MNTNIEKIIKYHTRKFKNREYYEDLQQDCRLAMYEALDRYSDNNDTKLTTYAYTIIKRVVNRGYIKYKSSIRTPIGKESIEVISSICSTKDGDEDLFEDIESKPLYNNTVSNNLKIAKNNLKKEQYRLVELLINGYSKREIARKLNISPQAVDDRFKVITKKLKNKWEEI